MAYKIIAEGSDFYTVQGVPIFQMHTDRGFPCDESWMTTAVQNHALLRAGGYRPTIVIGHNRKGGVEKESVGFLDNLVVKGKLLYADLVRIPKAIKEKIVKNAFPNRSVEVLPKSKRILCMALLGGTTPHFSLPQIVFENQEESEWYPYERGNVMFNDEQKQEIYEIVGAAVSETVPEVLTQFLGEPAEGEEATEIFVDPETNEEYAVPAGLAKLLSAGGKAAGKVGAGASKVPGAIKRNPLKAAAVSGLVGLNVGALGQKHHDRKSGYAIDEDSGEVTYDGEPLGVVVTYAELSEAGMKVPTAPKRPDALPGVTEAKPKLTIKKAAVGVGAGQDSTLSAAPGDVTGPGFIQPLARADSEQFELDVDNLEAQNYDLHQRLEQVENANALITEGRRAKEYSMWLTEQKAAGVPVGDVTKTVEYMMTQLPVDVENFKQLLLAQPKVAFKQLDEVKQFKLTDETSLRAEYEAHKETYQALGVNAEDLAWAKYIRTNTGVGEAVVTG